MALYATDVKFQPRFHPTGSMEESKKYFRVKHKQYGYKVEVSVLPNGLFICCREHEAGSTSDLTIFQQKQYLHKRLLKKNRVTLTTKTTDRCQISSGGAGLCWSIKFISGNLSCAISYILKRNRYMAY